MEKKNQKFGIDSILDIALGAVVVINALVGRFVTNQVYPIALRGVFKVLFWGILAVASGLLLRRFFVNALGKAKRKMILSLIALFIVGVISVITFSINSSQMAAKIAIGLVTMIDGLNLSFGWIAVLLVALLLLGVIGLSVLLIKEPSTKSGFLGILNAVVISYLVAFAFWNFSAFLLLLSHYILIIFIVKAVTRKKTERTSGMQHRSSDSRNYSYTVYENSGGNVRADDYEKQRRKEEQELEEYNNQRIREKEERRKEDQRNRLLKEMDGLKTKISILENKNRDLDAGLRAYQKGSLSYNVDPKVNRSAYEDNLKEIGWLKKKIEKIEDELRRL